MLLYTVFPGDTMQKIAHRLGIPVDELIRLNPLSPHPVFKSKQVIKIPCGQINTFKGIVRNFRYDIPYDYDEMQSDIWELKQRYPFLQVQPLGYSVMGRELTVIRLGSGVKEVHYNGAHHAREWMTSQLLMKFVEGYAGAYQRRSKLAGFNVRQVFKTTTIWVVPMVNPDGVDIVQHKVTPAHPYYKQLMQWNGGSRDFTRWKANIRGVDLNRQYMANWIIAWQSGPQEPASEGYAGPFPESEPESRAIAELIRSRPFRLIIAYHAQGQVIYWNYLNLSPPEARTIAGKFQRLSGYTPKISEYTCHGGLKDWFILDFRKPGFTIEIGKGTTPLPSSQFPVILRNNLGILMYASTV